MHASLASRYAVLSDDLADQAALVDRMRKARGLGKLVEMYRRRTSFFPDFEA